MSNINADLIEVTKKDGTKEIVTYDDAVELKDDNDLAEPVEDNKALTLVDFWGSEYEASL